MPLIRLRKKGQPRSLGMAALEVVLTTGLTLPMAAALYFILERTLDRFFFLVSNAVGWPFM